MTTVEEGRAKGNAERENIVSKKVKSCMSKGGIQISTASTSILPKVGTTSFHLKLCRDIANKGGWPLRQVDICAPQCTTLDEARCQKAQAEQKPKREGHSMSHSSRQLQTPLPVPHALR